MGKLTEEEKNILKEYEIVCEKIEQLNARAFEIEQELNSLGIEKD